jgi:hypothetical protein
VKLNAWVLTALFFLVGIVGGMKSELLTLSRLHTDVSWNALLEPLSLVNIISDGLMVMVAYMIQSPLPKQLIIKSVSGLFGADGLDAVGSAPDPSAVVASPDGVKAASIPANSSVMLEIHEV